MRGKLPDDLLGGVGAVRGVVAAALLDRSGRVLARHGFPDRDVLTQLAALAAGIHATGGRLSEAVGDAVPPRIELGLGGSRATLSQIPLPAGGPLLLLLVLDGGEADAEQAGALRGQVNTLARLAGDLLLGGVGVQSAEEFEASLDAAVDRLFPDNLEGGGNPKS